MLVISTPICLCSVYTTFQLSLLCQFHLTLRCVALRYIFEQRIRFTSFQYLPLNLFNQQSRKTFYSITFASAKIIDQRSGNITQVYVCVCVRVCVSVCVFEGCCICASLFSVAVSMTRRLPLLHCG